MRQKGFRVVLAVKIVFRRLALPVGIAEKLFADTQSMLSVQSPHKSPLTRPPESRDSGNFGVVGLTPRRLEC